MNRTTLGYLVMFVLAAAVLWTILRVGSRLKAAPDWSGEWQVVSPALPPRKAQIQQSGIFLHIRVGDGPTAAYKLVPHRQQHVLQGRHDALSWEYDKGPLGESLKFVDRTGSKPSVQLWRDQASPSAKAGHGNAH